MAPKKLAAARRGDVVQFRQRVRRAEVIVVLAQHAHRRLQRELRLVRLALLRDDAELGRAELRRRAIELTEPEEQQVCRHLRRRLEAHARAAVREIGSLRDRHVADGHLALRHDCFERERRLVRGLIPARDHATRIRRFELRVQRALAASSRVVVDCEQPRRLRADLAGVVERERVLARWDRLAEGEGRRLRRLVRRDLRIGGHGLALAVRDAHRCELQIHRVERDARRPARGPRVRSRRCRET